MIQFASIDQWPGKRTPNNERKADPFSARLEQTKALLFEELRKINATDVVLQTHFHPAVFSARTGWPYADAEVSDPGVILSFKSKKHGPLSFPCDRFQTFEGNLRALALSLQALRSVDRYGVTRNAEQYAGWKKLEAPRAANHFHTREEAEAFIRSHGGSYREAARRLHPDKSSGDHELFLRLQDAQALIEGAS